MKWFGKKRLLIFHKTKKIQRSDVPNLVCIVCNSRTSVSHERRQEFKSHALYFLFKLRRFIDRFTSGSFLLFIPLDCRAFIQFSLASTYAHVSENGICLHSAKERRPLVYIRCCFLFQSHEILTLRVSVQIQNIDMCVAFRCKSKFIIKNVSSDF